MPAFASSTFIGSKVAAGGKNHPVFIAEFTEVLLKYASSDYRPARVLEITIIQEILGHFEKVRKQVRVDAFLERLQSPRSVVRTESFHNTS